MTEDEEMEAVTRALSGAMAQLFGAEAKLAMVLIWGTPGERVHMISNAGADVAEYLVTGTLLKMQQPRDGEIDLRKTQ